MLMRLAMMRRAFRCLGRESLSEKNRETGAFEESIAAHCVSALAGAKTSVLSAPSLLTLGAVDVNFKYEAAATCIGGIQSNGGSDRSGQCVFHFVRDLSDCRPVYS